MEEVDAEVGAGYRHTYMCSNTDRNELVYLAVGRSGNRICALLLSVVLVRVYRHV